MSFRLPSSIHIIDRNPLNALPLPPPPVKFSSPPHLSSFSLLPLFAPLFCSFVSLKRISAASSSAMSAATVRVMLDSYLAFVHLTLFLIPFLSSFLSLPPLFYPLLLNPLFYPLLSFLSPSLQSLSQSKGRNVISSCLPERTEQGAYGHHG